MRRTTLVLTFLSSVLPLHAASAQELGPVWVTDGYDPDTPSTMADRVPGELLWGGLNAAAGLLGSGLVWAKQHEYARCRDAVDAGGLCDGSDSTLGNALLGAAVFTTPISIYLSGEANGGDGNFWATLGYGGLGVLGAAFASAPLWAPLSEAEQYETAQAVLFTTVWVGYLAGSLLGYELSSSSDYEEYQDIRASHDRSKLVLFPAVGTTSDQRGASLGLAGAF